VKKAAEAAGSTHGGGREEERGKGKIEA